MPPARLAVLAAAVLAAHLVLLDHAPDTWRVPPARSTQAFVTRRVPTQVAGAAAAPAPVAAAPAAPPKPAPPPRRRPPAKDAPAAEPEPEPSAPPPAAAPEPAPPPEPLALAIPDPARLNYEVTAERLGLTLHTSAHLTWRHDGTQYEAQLEVGGGLYPKRVQRSSGRIAPDGLSPERFSDKTRTEQATHFVREQGRIVFSNNKPEASLPPGVQDRASFIVQLASMLASAPARYPVGANIVLPVAGTSDVEPWMFTVEGEEDLQLPAINLKGLKLQRLPRKDYDVKVELWLAPRLDYAPVRLRLTNPNGESADLRWSGTDRP